jgi:hypothetical protein
MQRPLKALINKSAIFRIILIFIAAYIVALLLWILVRDQYCYTLAFVTSKIVAGLKGAKVEEVTFEGGLVKATFSPLEGRKTLLIKVPIQTNYTFNAPLTAAIMACLYMFIRRRTRAYGEALLILLGVHFLYVFSLEMKQITEAFMKAGIEKMNKPEAYTYQFLWIFTRSMIIRFEPFLIGFYMYMRFAKRPSEKSAIEK